jgi:hypothetical protein
MLKRNNILLLLVLIILGGLLWWLMQRDVGESTLSTYQGDFSVPDTNMIAKIRVMDRNNKTLTFERKDGFWMVNDTFKVEPRSMTEMLETVSQLEIRFIPPASMVPNILKTLTSYSKRIDVWNHKGEILKSYYVGGGTSDGIGTFAMMDGSEQPFVISMKSLYGSVAARFFMDIVDWRAKTLFDLNPEDIMSMSVDYPRNKEDGFVIKRKDKREFDVKPFSELTSVAAGKVDNDVVLTYLKNLPKFKNESYLSDPMLKDSLSDYVPFCQVSVLTKDSVEHIALFYSLMAMDRKGTTIMTPDGRPVSIDRFNVVTSWGDLHLVQYEPLKELFSPYKIFFRGK